MRLKSLSIFFMLGVIMASTVITASAQHEFTLNRFVEKGQFLRIAELTNFDIDFPDIEGWEKSKVTKYPQEALGYSVNYESEEGGRVTLYVYNGGKRKIPDGTEDSIHKSEIEKASDEIYAIEKMGMYKNVKEVVSDEVALGGESGKVQALHKLFNFTVRGQDVTSEIYLFGYKNNFIKIRATRALEEEGAKNAAMQGLLMQMDKLFANNATAAMN